MTKLKALYALQCIEYVREQYGDEGIARVKSLMDPVAREQVYAPLLLATDWVDVTHAIDHVLAIDRAFSRTREREASERMLCDLVARHYSGLYRPLFANAATPMMVLEKSSRLWNRFYDQGESQLEVHSATSVVKRIVGAPGMPRAHEILTNPYYEELLRQSGARTANARHVRCVATGAECCETLLVWRE